MRLSEEEGRGTGGGAGVRDGEQRARVRALLILARGNREEGAPGERVLRHGHGDMAREHGASAMRETAILQIGPCRFNSFTGWSFFSFFLKPFRSSSTLGN